MDTSKLTIIGTSHISTESINEVQQVLEKEQPERVCLELDRQRFHALLQPEQSSSWKNIMHIGVRGYLFVLLGGWVERYLGAKVGTKPGDEMRKALEVAKQKKLIVHCIDQPIQITLKRLFKGITLKEYARFFWDLISSPFSKRKITFDLASVPASDVIEQLLEEVKKHYPSVYRSLVEERNVYMARNLAKLMKKHPEDRFVAVIGAGHVDGVTDLLEKRFE